MAEFCEQTRQAFEGVITKPALTDKHLSRPPFRFIHDVVMAVVKSTGYLSSGVFSEDQLDSAKIADKDAKLAFLKALIEAVQNSIGSKIDVKPAKIMGGLEPEKTNTLLQVSRS